MGAVECLCDPKKGAVAQECSHPVLTGFGFRYVKNRVPLSTLSTYALFIGNIERRLGAVGLFLVQSV